VDHSHEWGREGSGDCGRVAIEEIGVSQSSQHGGLLAFNTGDSRNSIFM